MLFHVITLALLFITCLFHVQQKVQNPPAGWRYNGNHFTGCLKYKTPERNPHKQITKGRKRDFRFILQILAFFFFLFPQLMPFAIATLKMIPENTCFSFKLWHNKKSRFLSPFSMYQIKNDISSVPHNKTKNSVVWNQELVWFCMTHCYCSISIWKMYSGSASTAL